MLRNLKDKVLIHNPNVVFINISSNDSCNASNKLIGLKEFEENLTEILRLVRTHNNRTGLNGCMPIPVLITPSAVNEAVTGVSRTNNRLKQYIYIVKELAKNQKCPIVDLFGMMQNKENYLDYIGEDGYTINQKGHDLLYDLVFLELIKLINYQGVLKDRDIVADELRY
jgi:lysophospholipase L1-like esterase